MEQQDIALQLMRGIHRELIVLNWPLYEDKKLQRRLFTLIDAVEKINDQLAGLTYVESPNHLHEKRQEFIEEMASLLSDGYVEA